MRTAATIVMALLTLAVGLGRATAAGREATADRYGGRDMLVYVPSQPARAGSRALVIVLHGGLGNARRIATQQSEIALNMDAVAETSGFIVAYLNGTPVTRFLGDQVLGWNAGGGCCGQPAQNNVDDVAYIRGAVGYLAAKYGVDPGRVYGIGHSNGAMMTQRILCETTLFAAGVAVSGPLNLHTAACPAARGRRILAIHGSDDENVPVAGGPGTKGLARVAYVSEDASRKLFQDSGGAYALDLVPGADHMLDHIEARIEKTDGVTIAQKAARFFGILKPGS